MSHKTSKHHFYHFHQQYIQKSIKTLKIMKQQLKTNLKINYNKL